MINQNYTEYAKRKQENRFCESHINIMSFFNFSHELMKFILEKYIFEK